MEGRLRKLRREWQCFRSDPPGQRFQRHYRRAQRGRTTAGTVARFVAGPLLIAVGVLLWFLPGPGWLFVFAGLATLAGGSRSLARALDHLEVVVRRRGRGAHTWWSSAPLGTQIFVVAIGRTAFGGLGCAAWLMVA